MTWSGGGWARSSPALDWFQVCSKSIQDANLFRTHSVVRNYAIGATPAMIRISTRTFGLLTDGAQEVRSMLAEGDVADLSPRWRQRVLVSGRAVFRASGSLWRIEAGPIEEATEKDSFCARIPRPNRRRFVLRRLVHEQLHKRGVAAIMGQWPGDVPDEQIEARLKEMDCAPIRTGSSCTRTRSSPGFVPAHRVARSTPPTG